MFRQAAPLAIGSKAPAIKVAKWVKGMPLTQLVRGKIYVVEFWATWCPPCRESIPHLTDLAKKYAGKVTFAGISISEDDPKYLAKVAKFVKDMGPKMDYAVACDTAPSGGFMSKNWMDAARQEGIPSAFIVGKDGNIAWIGHPMEMDKPLAAIVAGNFDARAAARQAEAEKARQQKLQQAMMKVNELAQGGKFAEAAAAVDGVIKDFPEMAPRLTSARFQLLLRADEAQAYAFARSLVGSKTPAMILNDIAWAIADSKTLKNPDHDVALALAEQAATLTKHADWQVLDTLALCCFKKGQKERAISLQEKAIALMEKDPQAPGEAKAELKARLELFKKP